MAWLAAALLSCSGQVQGADVGESLVRDQIAPILEASCIDCHSGEKPQGGLALGNRSSVLAGGDSGPAVVPGDPDASLLIEYVSGDDPMMPQGRAPLSAEQIAALREWIAAGAIWPEEITLAPRRADRNWWSLQPLGDIAPPNPSGLPEAWASNGIDRFVYEKMVEKGLRPSPPAEKRALIRRVSYDLVGLPPTPEEIDDFLADDSPDAYLVLVDRLLASPHYGERWGRHWLDVVRFGESSGYERNHLRDNAWPFRDYIIRSFNEDKPFDQLVLEHLAGDQVAPDNPAVEVGTGFLVAGSYDDVGNQDPAAQAQIRANTLDDMIAATGAAFLGLTINCARCHDHKFDPILQADYYRLQSAVAGVQQGTRTLASAEERRAAAEASGAERKLPQAWIGSFTQPTAPSYLMIGGDPAKRGEDIAPASLSTLERVVPSYRLPLDAPEGERRLALARWIVDPQNPLTPRVLANRLWHYHFGRGIVGTPSDFGFNGEAPTHPELLDWLARQVHAQGWKLKPLHRLIVTSMTYRQAAAHDPAMAAIDADAHYLWRFPPRRLEAESVRDALLAVSGKLDATMGGPGFRLYQYTVDNVAAYTPLDKFGPETYRRTVYHQNPRSVRVDLLGQLDCPDCSLPAPKREVTVTPLQALALQNHSFMVDMAQAFAERLEREVPASDRPRQVERAFVLAFGRKPDSEETRAAVTLVEKHGLAVLCRALFNANEFLYVH